MTDIFWEKSYQNMDTSTFGKPSKEIVALADQLPQDAKVLDVGCGEGRHAVFLASLGFRVDAIDISQKGIEKPKRLADCGLEINAQVCDVSSFSSDNHYDLIIAHGVLQFMEVPKRDLAISKLKQLTKPGGYNVIAVFTNALEIPQDLKPHMVGVFKEEEICRYYDDWKTDMFEAYTFHDEHEGGIRHHHALNKAVFRKPSDNLHARS